MHTHHVKTEIFEGPIMVLHKMIEERKLSISDFSLVSITEDFLNYLKELPDINKEETTHFILMASVLILLKSKTLIPELELTPEEDRDILVLENQLRAYEILKERTKTISSIWAKKILKNAQVKYKNSTRVFVPDAKLSLDFFKNYIKLRLTEIIPKEEERKEVKVHKNIKIEDALSHIRLIIKRIKNISFRNLSNHGDERLREKNKKNLVILFLAVLELVKIGEIDAAQDGNFSDILVLESTS